MEQLRHPITGKFVEERIVLTLQDRVFLTGEGFTLSEQDRARDALNVRIDDRIKSGESWRNIQRELREVYESGK